jgi:hypothetical protein
MIIMISPILAKLYGSVLEKKISIWLEIHRKRAKGHASFRGYHSTVNHLVTLRIIVEEYHNNKPIFFVVSLTLGKLLTLCLGLTYGIG